MQYVIPRSLLENCGTACPTQWEGQTTAGERVYIRYRNAWLTLDIDGETVYEVDHGYSGQGVLETDMMIKLLEPVALFPH